MKIILSARLSVEPGEPLNQFFRGEANTVRNKIINLVQKNQGAEFDFLVQEDGTKSIKHAGDLLGEVVNIVDDKCIAEFIENEDGEIEVLFSLFEGALPRESTVKQLKKIRKKTKGIDIGDRISKMTGQGANLAWDRNPVDTGVESMEDYWSKSKSFKPNTNLKRFKDIK